MITFTESGMNFSYEEQNTLAPNPNVSKGRSRFEEFMEELCVKFRHSMAMCYAILHDVHGINDSTSHNMGAVLKS